jgi:predicted RNA-binding protein YlxR (DUF448 family)
LSGTRVRRYPERTCVACRTSRQKRELLRVVRSPDGRIDVDQTGRAPGRGAYLCADGSCWQTATDRNSLERSLGRALAAPVPAELRAQLEASVRGASPDARMTTTNEGELIGQK